MPKSTHFPIVVGNPISMRGVFDYLALIIPLNFIILLFIIIFDTMQIDPITAYIALRRAKRDSKLKINRSDWEILSCLYSAKKGLTISSLQREFNATSKPNYGAFNSWYYQGLGRLVTHGLASETISPKGWRRWHITLGGRIEIDKLNKAAIKLLEEWAAEDH